MKNIPDVSPIKAYAMIQKGALLVDVREPYEVAKKSFDVPEILLIPLRELENRFREIPADRKVIIACNLGNRSLSATRFLMKKGYSKVVNMQSGIVRWVEEGLPFKGKPQKNAWAWLLKLFSKNS
jgi:rhodanese-related sulfurtransferase